MHRRNRWADQLPRMSDKQLADLAAALVQEWRLKGWLPRAVMPVAWHEAVELLRRERQRRGQQLVFDLRKRERVAGAGEVDRAVSSLERESVAGLKHPLADE